MQRWRLDLPDELEAFRSHVAARIAALLPADIQAQVAKEDTNPPREMQQRWHRLLHAEGGWGVFTWQAQLGGPGWSLAQQYLFDRELAFADAPRPMLYGLWLGPTLAKFGTPEQVERFLPAIVAGEAFWCQGFSEPNSGSDLASLSCKAFAAGDHYVINGSKIWTTEAHIADRMVGLFRTSVEGRKQEGITALLVDLKSPGIHIRPIPLFDGTHEINQMDFDNVVVPVGDRLGHEGDGWRVAKSILSTERLGTAEVGRSIRSLERLRATLSRMPGLEGRAVDDPEIGRAFDRLELELEALDGFERRALFETDATDDALTPSMLKFWGTELQQKIHKLAFAAQRHNACAMVKVDNPNALPDSIRQGGLAARAYFNYRKSSIHSGSNEIQRDIVAKLAFG